MVQMFLTDRKLDRRITEVKNYRYRDLINLETFAVCEDEQGVVNPQVPGPLSLDAQGDPDSRAVERKKSSGDFRFRKYRGRK